MNFTWIPFYKEFAEKLLQFRNNRKELLHIIYEHQEEFLAGYLHDENGKDDLLKDIDPFTTMGIFNRGVSNENRLHIIRTFKDILNISADVPSDFQGVPILDNRKSHFFGSRSFRKKNDIENLWKLFERLVRDEDCESEYNVVIKQYIININITMGMFWIRPDKFLAFDRVNRTYLNDAYSFHLPYKALPYADYMAILNEIKNNIESNVFKENSFFEISSNANPGKETVYHQDYADDDYDDSWYGDIVQMWRHRKNLIFYGAPGTGKTYDLPEYIVRLCRPDLKVQDLNDRKKVMECYNQLKRDKRVAFTTFHQSMDYEDWLEGLRPVVDNNQVSYEIEPGIFKRLCEEAERPLITEKGASIASDAVVWKVSLMGTGDNPVRRDCMENNYIRIGWDGYGPVINEETDWSVYDGEGRQILDTFINKMKEGDIVMSCYSRKTIDAIGVVTGDYKWIDFKNGYNRTRRVKWLVKGINENIVELNEDKMMTLGTVYRLNSISLDKVKLLLDKYNTTEAMEDNKQPYVMVIDEINRGNVSKIFGELITLLEPDKRKGCINAESAILPYSKKAFQIPDNVYIVATMNTADRSLGTLDYAIRRRFAFVSTKPYVPDNVELDYDLFKEVSNLFISNFEDYEKSDWNPYFKLEPADTLSEEYKPEDVWIGHSYFITSNDEDINDKLLYDVIPLLEEYITDGVLTSEAQSTIDYLYSIATGE